MAPEEIRALIGESCFQSVDVLTGGEVNCGDLYSRPRGKVLLNLRADCDCVPRDGVEVGDVELYCVEGKFMRPAEVGREYDSGHFPEKVWGEYCFFSL